MIVVFTVVVDMQVFVIITITGVRLRRGGGGGGVVVVFWFRLSILLFAVVSVVVVVAAGGCFFGGVDFPGTVECFSDDGVVWFLR